MQVGLSESRKFCLNSCSQDVLSVLYYQCNFFRVCRRPDETENTFLKKVKTCRITYLLTMVSIQSSY